MRDAEHEYPLHQSHQHNGNGHHGVLDRTMGQKLKGPYGLALVLFTNAK